MKQTIRSITSIGLFSGLCIVAANNYADTAEAGQTVSVNVPKTLLLAIQDTNASITYTAPTIAGESFSSKNSNGNKNIKVAITSNIETAKLYAKATVNNGQPLSAFNLEIDIEGDGGILNNEITLSDQDRLFANVSHHASGVLAVTKNKLDLSGGLANSSAIPPSGQYDVVITYTLKEN